MVDLLDALKGLGEVATVHTLRRMGATDGELRAAAKAGTIRRPRRGWYASPAADAEQVRAVLLHAKLGCVSALQRHGAWSGPGGCSHFQVATNASRLGTIPAPFAPAEFRHVAGVYHPQTPARRRRGIRLGDPRRPHELHWADDPAPRASLDWVVSPHSALAQAIRCLSREHAQAAVDSVVAERILRRPEVERIVGDAPSALGVVVDGMTGRLESGVESLFARRLVDNGFRVEPQFDFGSHGRYDGLIDDCVLYEVDGWKHHSSRESFVGDRERNLVGQAFGVPVIRPAALHVLEDWELVLAAVRRTVDDARLLRDTRRLAPR